MLRAAYKIIFTANLKIEARRLKPLLALFA